MANSAPNLSSHPKWRTTCQVNIHLILAASHWKVSGILSTLHPNLGALGHNFASERSAKRNLYLTVRISPSPICTPFDGRNQTPQSKLVAKASDPKRVSSLQKTPWKGVDRRHHGQSPRLRPGETNHLSQRRARTSDMWGASMHASPSSAPHPAG